MAADNQTTIVGNLAEDPEVHFTKQGPFPPARPTRLWTPADPGLRWASRTL